MVCLPMPGKRGSVTRAWKRRRPRRDRGAGGRAERVGRGPYTVIGSAAMALQRRR